MAEATGKRDGDSPRTRGCQGTHLTIADKQQAGLAQPRLDALDQRNIETIIGSLPREHIRGQRHPQRVQGPHHHFELRSTGIIFTVPKLHQPLVGDVVIT